MEQSAKFLPSSRRVIRQASRSLTAIRLAMEERQYRFFTPAHDDWRQAVPLAKEQVDCALLSAAPRKHFGMKVQVGEVI